MTLQELDLITQFCSQTDETKLLWYSQASQAELDKMTELLLELDEMMEKQLDEMNNPIKRNFH